MDSLEDVAGTVLLIIMAMAPAALFSGHVVAFSGASLMTGNFHQQLFPNKTVRGKKPDDYCKFNNLHVAFYGISNYIGGFAWKFIVLLVGIFGITLPFRIGPKICSCFGAIVSGVGSVILICSVNANMLNCGRAVQGFGGAIIDQYLSAYSAEISPTSWSIPLAGYCLVFSTLGASLTYGIAYIQHSNDDGLTVLQYIFLGVLSFIVFFAIVDNKLSSRARVGNGTDLIVPSNTDGSSTRALVAGILIQVLQSLMGIMLNPVIFQAIGFGEVSALGTATLKDSLGCLPLILAVVLVHKLKVSRVNLVIAGIFMMASSLLFLFLVKVMIADPDHAGIAIIISIILHVFSNGILRGTLSTLTATEIYPDEIRSVGENTSTLVGMLSSALMGQFYLPMLCAMEYWIFLLYTAILVAMIFFILMLIPEEMCRTCRRCVMPARHIEANNFRLEQISGHSLCTTSSTSAMKDNDEDFAARSGSSLSAASSFSTINDSDKDLAAGSGPSLSTSSTTSDDYEEFAARTSPSSPATSASSGVENEYNRDLASRTGHSLSTTSTTLANEDDEDLASRSGSSLSSTSATSAIEDNDPESAARSCPSTSTFAILVIENNYEDLAARSGCPSPAISSTSAINDNDEELASRSGPSLSSKSTTSAIKDNDPELAASSCPNSLSTSTSAILAVEDNHEDLAARSGPSFPDTLTRSYIYYYLPLLCDVKHWLFHMYTMMSIIVVGCASKLLPEEMHRACRTDYPLWRNLFSYHDNDIEANDAELAAESGSSISAKSATSTILSSTATSTIQHK